MSTNKKPKTAHSLVSSKTPKIEFDPESSQNRLHPSWRVYLLEMVDPFGWHVINREKLYEIREKLAEFEKLTWNEILVQSKYQCHTIEVEQISKEARDRLKEKQLDDVERLVSLRLSGKERVWGIRDLGVLILLWWDADHLVYPSFKKHT